MVGRDVTVKRFRFASARASALLPATLLLASTMLAGCQPYPQSYQSRDRGFEPYATSSMQPYPALPSDYRPKQQAYAPPSYASPPPRSGAAVQPAGADPQMLALSSL